MSEILFNLAGFVAGVGITTTAIYRIAKWVNRPTEKDLYCCLCDGALARRNARCGFGCCHRSCIDHEVICHRATWTDLDAIIPWEEQDDRGGF